MDDYTSVIWENHEDREDVVTGQVYEGRSLGWSVRADFGTPGTYSWGSIAIAQGLASREAAETRYREWLGA